MTPCNCVQFEDHMVYPIHDSQEFQTLTKELSRKSKRLQLHQDELEALLLIYSVSNTNPNPNCQTYINEMRQVINSLQEQIQILSQEKSNMYKNAHFCPYIEPLIEFSYSY